MGPGAAPDKRYKVFLCGDYPVRSVSPYRIRVGTEETAAGGGPLGLVGYLAARPAVGDPVCLRVHGTEICVDRVEPEDVADLGP